MVELSIEVMGKIKASEGDRNLLIRNKSIMNGEVVGSDEIPTKYHKFRFHDKEGVIQFNRRSLKAEGCSNGCLGDGDFFCRDRDFYLFVMVNYRDPKKTSELGTKYQGSAGGIPDHFSRNTENISKINSRPR